MKENFMGVRSGGTVKRVAVVGACALMLQACAMPVPLKIASWALDGISYLATQKSLTDHGISAVVQKDCALLRTIQGEDVCRANEDEGLVLAAADLGATVVPVTADDVKEAATVEPTRDEGGVPSAEWVEPAEEAIDQKEIIEAATLATAAGEAAVESVAERAVGEVVAAEAPAVVLKAAAKPAPASVEPIAAAPTPAPWGELYYVVASFKELERADTVLARYPHLDLRVMEGTLDGKSVYRVAAGPFQSGDGSALRRSIRKQGLKNAWAVRMPASRWTVARGPGNDNQMAAADGGAPTVVID